MTRSVLLLALLAVATSGPAGAQDIDPCHLRDTTAWDPGPGWETLGNCTIQETTVFHVGHEGILYGADTDVLALHVLTDPRGRWRRIHPDNQIFDGVLDLTTADSLVSGYSVQARRSVDRGATWIGVGPAPIKYLYEAPPGALRAGRLFTSLGSNGYPLQLSDDRGASWRRATRYPPDYEISPERVVAYPAVAAPGATPSPAA